MDIVVFIERQVRIESDPVFGDLQDKNYGNSSKFRDKNKSPPRTKIRRNSFATTVVTADHDTVEDSAVNSKLKRPSVQSKTTRSNVCLHCFRDHGVEQCPLLEEKTHRHTTGQCSGQNTCLNLWSYRSRWQ